MGGVPRGTNLPRVGGYNEAVLLDAVRRSADGISRVQLARETGLAAQTVSNIVRRLLEQDFLQPVGVRREGRGKPQTVLALNPGRSFAVGIHLDPSVVITVVCDLRGTVIAEHRGAAIAAGDVSAAVDALAHGVESAIAASGIDRGLLAGVGVAVPGPLDVDGGTVFQPAWLAGGGDVHLAAALQERLGVPVQLDKDTVAAVVGETWAAEDSAPSVLFVYVGTGIGSAVAVEGGVIRGASGNAGEIGHLVVDASGPVCPCGRRGCLGRATDPAWLVRDAAAAGLLPLDAGVKLTSEQVDTMVTTLAAAALAGDPGSRELVERAARAVAEAVRVLVALHDTARVVLGGPFWSRFAPIYLPAIRRALQTAPEGPRVPPQVGESAFGERVGARGAASLVLDAAYSPRPADLLVGGQPGPPQPPDA